MRPLVVTLCGLVSIAGAQAARQVAIRDVPRTIEEPYAPSTSAAPLVSLGYREMTADLLYFRLVGYFGGGKYEPEAIARLVEAIAALDPHMKRIYRWGALAIMMSAHEARDPQPLTLRAIDLLERGARLYPDDYDLPRLAGEAYVADLRTTDQAQRRIWHERGARLLEAASRKPNAPADAALLATALQTKLGQHQRAKDSLTELFAITDDLAARARIVEQLAELESADSADLAAELLENRRVFETAWRSDRPYLAPSLWIHLGRRPPPGVDMADLATGGRDLAGATLTERLEPIPP